MHQSYHPPGYTLSGVQTTGGDTRSLATYGWTKKVYRWLPSSLTLTLQPKQLSGTEAPSHSRPLQALPPPENPVCPAGPERAPPWETSALVGHSLRHARHAHALASTECLFKNVGWNLNLSRCTWDRQQTQLDVSWNLVKRSLITT